MASTRRVGTTLSLAVAAGLALAGCSLTTSEAGVRVRALGPTDTKELDAATCGLLSSADLQSALGVTDDLPQPTAAGQGACAWHSPPNCSLRSLSIEVHKGSAAVKEFEAARGRVLDGDLVSGIGDAAFLTADDLPPGAAILVEHLDVRRGGTWLHLTLLGRISLVTGETILSDAAKASLSRVWP